MDTPARGRILMPTKHSRPVGGLARVGTEVDVRRASDGDAWCNG